MFHYCRQLSFYEEPNYLKLLAFIEIELKEMDVELDHYNFEWQKQSSSDSCVPSSPKKNMRG